jgi:3-methyl-2-oxobutanoate hydroxymethyltransferase
MSVHTTNQRLTVPAIRALKKQRPIVALTAYTTPFARILDAHSDILLVGDSLGMVIYGMESTLGVTLDDMIRHGQAVKRGAEHALVVVDMPFGSYQASIEQAFNACARVMRETGCDAVKMEGGEELAETVAFITKRGIPVMGHIGLMPQRVHAYGGYKYQGRTHEDQTRIMHDAQALEQAGAFSVVMECMDKHVAKTITDSLSIPTIGIGAGVGCDGQILVTEDMAGLFQHHAKFVRTFGSMHHTLTLAVEAYALAVRQRSYPNEKESFGTNTQ